MKLSPALKTSMWLVVVLIVLMALSSIWVFERMSPAIEQILHQNERSLHACTRMLEALVLRGIPNEEEENIRKGFLEALAVARNNITETGESGQLAIIEQHHERALEGESLSTKLTVTALMELVRINQKAMFNADRRAKKLGQAGAWIVVFMALCVFFAAILSIRGLTRAFLVPMGEIHDVLSRARKGDTLRRCSGTQLAPEMRFVYESINEMLDRKPHREESPPD